MLTVVTKGCNHIKYKKMANIMAFFRLTNAGIKKIGKIEKSILNRFFSPEKSINRFLEKSIFLPALIVYI